MNKKKIIIIVSILVLIVLAIVLWKTQKNSSEIQTYKEHKVKKGEIKITILSTGVVQPQNRLGIKPPIPGRIEKILVSEGDKVRAGQIIAWMSSTERAALIDSATAKGADEVKKWEELYKQTPIIAPINGTIILRNVETGQTFTNQDAIFVMSDRLTVKAQVDETDIAQIKVKQKCLITLDAYQNKPIPAVVDEIAYDAKTVNNVTTYIVDALPTIATPFMRSGMTANVVFDVLTKDNILIIPTEAIKYKEGKPNIEVRENPKAKPLYKEISIGATDGKNTEITSGLIEGETILISDIISSDKSQKTNSPFGMPKMKRGK